jgi:hypothetical protein
MAIYQRISARRGNTVQLDTRFLRGGIPTAPYALRKVEIYKTQIIPSNLIASFIVVDPWESNYPSPVEYIRGDTPDGLCGTEGEQGAILPGEYRLLLDIPADAAVPDVYFDVWSYLPTNPCDLVEFADSCAIGTDGHNRYPDLNDPALSGLILQACSKFWVYADDWDVQDSLTSVRLGFEPLDQKFNQPEVRPLEIGIMPLPLYDYDFNLVAPILPQLIGTITIQTENNEVLVEEEPLTIGLRQGSYRSNPYVFRYMVDTSRFLKGTYQYKVNATLPDGSTRCSKSFILTIS